MKSRLVKKIMAVAIASVMLVGCGNSRNSAEEESITSNTQESTSQESSVDLANVNIDSIPPITDSRGTEEKMNKFTTLNGNEVEYNMNTRKIVCISGSQDVVSFGISLLAYEGTSDITGYEQYYDGASALLNSTPFSAEEIMSYEPELILVNQRMSDANIEALSKIAPVIPLYTDSTDFKTRLEYIGQIFGMESEATELVNYADALKANYVNQINDLGLSGKTLTLYTYMGSITIPPERGWFMNTILYDYLGMDRTDKVKEFMEDESGVAYAEISAEKLREYEGDLVMFASVGDQTISTYVTENVGWQSLKAVQEDRVGVIDISIYAQKGLILLDQQYNQIFEALKVSGAK